MGDVLICEPAHEIVKVSCQSLVPFGNEALLTMRTMVDDRRELYHLPTDSSRLDHEIEGTLTPRLHSLRPPLRVERHDTLASAERAARGPDLHSVCRPQITIVPVPAPRLTASSLPL